MLRFIASLFGNKSRNSHSSTRPRARIGVEELVPRVLPSASLMTFAAEHFDHHDHVWASSATTSTTDNDSDSDSGHGCHAGATLAATLSNASGATGSALFNANTGTLNVQVQTATASTALDIPVDGTKVGTVATNASGAGETSLSNVAVKAGSKITVGDLAGAFAQIKLTASLSDASGVSGTATFNTLNNDFKVSITGAAANTTYNVTIGGTVVGKITTDDDGHGHLRLSKPSVAIASMSAVSISDTQGNPAILTGTFA